MMRFGQRSGKLRPRAGAEIDPDEVLLDASNLPSFDPSRLEGRIEMPIAKRSIAFVAIAGTCIALLFTVRLFDLQILQGEAYAAQSESNRLERGVLFAQRGVIYDRTGAIIVANEPGEETDDHAVRAYTDIQGLAHLIGYVAYPRKDDNGVYYQSAIEGKDGVEALMNDLLQGENGMKLTERDARGEIRSEGLIRPPHDGAQVTLSIDAEVTRALHRAIAATAQTAGYRGGAGVVMDIHTGELLAMTSYPEYSPAALSSGDAEAIDRYQDDPATPFLNRAVSGLYAPGSVMKPFVAAAALQEGIISPDKQILSTGSISIPNPYNPSKPSIFKDWKAHGWVDMREAIAVSSDVYFYAVGGGYQDQKGLGIATIDAYMRAFGFGAPTGIALSHEAEGTIPTPEWKAEHFEDGVWRLGDTYNSSIGQYGFQTTVLQLVRGVAALANGGLLLTPTLVSGPQQPGEEVGVNERALQIVREGMRRAVTHGTALGLSQGTVALAGKTGTAQVGARNEFQNAWVVGFFPYDNPRYAFAVVMERAKAGTGTGAVYAMRQFLDWMIANKAEYLAEE